MTPQLRTDPYRNYRFLVQIDALIAGGFTDVSGLEREIDTHQYDEGGVNDHTHDLWSGETTSNLTLERGLTDADTLWDWIERSAARPVDRKTVLVFVLDEQGQAAAGWSLSEAYPVRWSGPDLRADTGEVAVESLELTHTGVDAIEGL